MCLEICLSINLNQYVTISQWPTLSVEVVKLTADTHTLIQSSWNCVPGVRLLLCPGVALHHPGWQRVLRR